MNRDQVEELVLHHCEEFLNEIHSDMEDFEPEVDISYKPHYSKNIKGEEYLESHIIFIRMKTILSRNNKNTVELSVDELVHLTSLMIKLVHLYVSPMEETAFTLLPDGTIQIVMRCANLEREWMDNLIDKVSKDEDEDDE